MKTTAEKLQELHQKGWRDERVATWIEDKYRSAYWVDEGDKVIGPSSQSVYRWRKGTTIPSNLNSELISDLYTGEFRNEENHQN